MALEGLALEFQTRIMRIRNKLNKVSSTFGGMEDYFSKIDEIINSFSDRTDGINLLGVASKKRSDNDKIYLNGIKMLDELEKKVDILGNFYDIHLDSLSIKEKLVNKISEDDLDKYVSELINLLDKIKKIKNCDYQKVSSVIDELYSVILYVMKIEILRNGKSTLFDKLKTSENDKTILGNLIKIELEDTSFRQRSNYLANILEKIGVNKTSFDYYDERLIFILGIINDQDIECKISNRMDALKNSMEQFTTLNEVIDEELKTLKGNINDYKKWRLDDLKTGSLNIFLSLVLICSFLLSGYGTFRLGKRTSSSVSKNTTITSYSSLNDEYVTEDGIYTKYKKGDIYYQEVFWYDYNVRKIVTYWIRTDKNSVKFDDIKEYLDYEKLFKEDYTFREAELVSADKYDFLSDSNYTVVGEVTDVDKSDKLIIRRTGWDLTLDLIGWYFLFAVLWGFIIGYLIYDDILVEIFDYSDLKNLKSYKIRIDEEYEKYKEKLSVYNANEEEIKKISLLYEELDLKYAQLFDLIEERKGMIKKRELSN